MEQDLINGCIKEDRLAQKRLYERFYGKMLSVCLRYASGRDEAKEILNQGFLKVFKNIKAYEDNNNLEGWIYRIMVHTAIDHVRAELRHQSISTDKAVFVEESYNVLAEMEAEQIMDLVNQLTPSYRTVFNLYVVEGYNHREIAELLGINEGTSKSNLAKAKANLQQLIRSIHRIKLENYV